MWGHEVKLSVLGLAMFSIVYLFADAGSNKNVLGRVGWLAGVRFGLVEHDSHTYLAPYNQA